MFLICIDLRSARLGIYNHPCISLTIDSYILGLLFIACCAATEKIQVCIYMLGEFKWLGQVHVVMSNRVCLKPKNSFSFH